MRNRASLLNYFVPVVMLVVFFAQLALVEFGNLDRWKGMGMGMFSSINNRGVAELAVKTEAEEWRTLSPAELVQHEKTILLLQQFPNAYAESVVLRHIQRTNPEVTDIRVEVVGVDSFNPRTGVLSEKNLYASE